MPRNQTHDLVANRSKRCEEHGIEAVLAAQLEDLGAARCDVLPWL
jgi:hypothetical protein